MKNVRPRGCLIGSNLSSGCFGKRFHRSYPLYFLKDGGKSEEEKNYKSRTLIDYLLVKKYTPTLIKTNIVTLLDF